MPLRKTGLGALARIVADTGTQYIPTTSAVTKRLAGLGLEALSPE